MSLFNILIDWIHLVSATAWIGGLIFLNLVYLPVLNSLDPKDRGKANVVMVKNFARLASISGGLLILTGIFNLPGGESASDRLDSWSTIHEADAGNYFNFFLVKLLFIVTLFAIGFYVPLVLSPRAQSLAPKPGEKPSEEFVRTQALIIKLGRINALVGVGVLFFAAVLLNGGLD